MSKISRDEYVKNALNDPRVNAMPQKEITPKRTANAIVFSIAGLKYAFQQEQSIMLEGIITVILVIMGIVFKISRLEWLILGLVMVLLMVTELLNTSVEATVDLCTDKYHPLAKIAKDCGSAATFLMTLLAIVLLGAIFIPEIMALFK